MFILFVPNVPGDALTLYNIIEICTFLLLKNVIVIRRMTVDQDLTHN